MPPVQHITPVGEQSRAVSRLFCQQLFYEMPIAYGLALVLVVCRLIDNCATMPLLNNGFIRKLITAKINIQMISRAL